MAKPKQQDRKIEYFNTRPVPFPAEIHPVYDLENKTKKFEQLVGALKKAAREVNENIPSWITTHNFEGILKKNFVTAESSDDYFMRWWLDYYINNLSYEIWNFVFYNYRNKFHNDKKAGQTAEASVKKFKDKFK